MDHQQQQQVRDDVRARERRRQRHLQKMTRHSVVREGHVKTSSAVVSETETAHHQHHHQEKAHRSSGSNMPGDGFITRHDSVAGDPLRDANWNASAAKSLPFSSSFWWMLDVITFPFLGCTI
jgi:hypothetical protein